MLPLNRPVLCNPWAPAASPTCIRAPAARPPQSEEARSQAEISKLHAEIARLGLEVERAREAALESRKAMTAAQVWA